MKKIRSGQFKEAQFVFKTFSARPEEGTVVEDILAPAYWANIAEQLQPGSRIEVMPLDGAFFAELIVVSSNRTAAVVVPLRVVDLTLKVGATESGDDPEYSVKFRGPRKFCVIRNADGQPVIEDIDTKEQAYRELSDYVKAHKPRAA
jgi:hypothetical protein